jgi:hypothetical protein
MEPIRLSGEQLQKLQAAIPFQRPAGQQPIEPPIMPVSDLDAAPMQSGEAGDAAVADPEPYRKKFRKKSDGDVVSQTGGSHNPYAPIQSLDRPHSRDGDSAL